MQQAKQPRDVELSPPMQFQIQYFIQQLKVKAISSKIIKRKSVKKAKAMTAKVWESLSLPKDLTFSASATIIVLLIL